MTRGLHARPRGADPEPSQCPVCSQPAYPRQALARQMCDAGQETKGLSLIRCAQGAGETRVVWWHVPPPPRPPFDSS
jgi:hypothetical protein